MDSSNQALDARGGAHPYTASELLPLLYDQLRQLAAHHLAREAPGQTLQPTALVHEAYLRLVGNNPRRHWDGRAHFFAAAAEAMRRILVDNSRRKRTQKRGGGWQRHDATELPLAAPEPIEDLLALDEALDRLAALDPLKADLVKLRYFAGMTLDEAADVLGMSLAGAKRCWAFTRAWLYREMGHPSVAEDTRT